MKTRIQWRFAFIFQVLCYGLMLLAYACSVWISMAFWVGWGFQFLLGLVQFVQSGYQGLIRHSSFHKQYFGVAVLFLVVLLGFTYFFLIPILYQSSAWVMGVKNFLNFSLPILMSSYYLYCTSTFVPPTPPKRRKLAQETILDDSLFG